MSDRIYPGDEIISDPLIELTYSVEVDSQPDQVWPWIIQMGYHRAGWYIDTWWDRFAQKYIWPILVPKEARGSYLPPAEEILPEFQNLQVGDTIPDGPPGTAYYEVLKMEHQKYLLLCSTSHFKYMAPPFLAGTRFEPYGEFSWTFILEKMNQNKTRITSHWRGTGGPYIMMMIWKPIVILADRAHQRQILIGIKRHVESQ